MIVMVVEQANVMMVVSLLYYGVNVFLFVSGGLVIDSAPLALPLVETHPDPLPQALVLTAIVIGFGMTAFTITLAVRARGELGSDHVDGHQDEPRDGERENGR